MKENIGAQGNKNNSDHQKEYFVCNKLDKDYTLQKLHGFLP